MPQQGVIFDVDGVLMDSSELHLQSWQRMGGEAGFVMTEELFRETFGMPNRPILARLFPEPLSEERVRELSERKEVLYRELAWGRLSPLPGVVRLVQALRAHGFRLAIGSSTPWSNIQVVLDALDLQDAFDAIVTGDDVTHGKPHPEVFLKAAERLNLPPGCCVVIEDAVVGVQAAKASGARCLAVTTTHPRERLAEADRIVDSLDEVAPQDFEVLLRTCGTRSQ